MKKILTKVVSVSFVAALLLSVASAQTQTAAEKEPAPWQMYTLSGEDFSFAVPVLPGMHMQNQFIDSIRRYRRMYSMGSYADGVVYIVQVFENPEHWQSLDSFIKAVAANRSDFKETTLDGVSGKTSAGEGYVSYFFARDHRLYHFGALGAQADDPRVTKFITSLSLRKNKGSVEVIDGPGLPYEPAGEAEASNIDTTSQSVTGKEVDRKARLGLKVEPSYTESARQNAVTGTVVLKVVFSSKGSVTNIRVVSGLPYGLTEQAIDAARKIKFIPAMKNGKYVSMWIQLEYNFNLY